MNAIPSRSLPGQRKSRPQQGFTLLEVLITAVILAIGLLGLAALQTAALRSNDGAYMRSQATILAYDMLDRMRANREAALAGDYDINLSAAAPSGGSVADEDLQNWLDDLQSTLPAGDGAVDCPAGAACRITVVWNDLRANGDTTASWIMEARL